ncbi:MAG: response regulator, partial [Thermoplasmatales archaeon]|nr:response regulator [Thermoplasmatales archaeon]
DIMMPEMSGWETFDKLKENASWGKIPIVFLTARKDRIAKDAGDFLAEDYIEKPAKIPELKQRLDNILKK